MSDYPIIYDDERSSSPPTPAAPSTAWRTPVWIAAAASLLGAVFSGLSTSDFVQHLDRQVHSIHCSFIPGAGAELGESGCRTVMMSPYSSMFRQSMWGGLPISLLAFAVFFYLVYRATSLALGKSLDRAQATFLLAATGLPLAMSLIYGIIAATQIGAMCKLCVGVYLTSATAFGAALVAFKKTSPAMPATKPYARWFVEGVMYVGVLTFAYMALTPTTDKSLKGCGTLARGDDPNGIFISMGSPRVADARAIAVLDPLCPACKGFDERLAASGLTSRMDMKVVLFPLDATCNWMVKESLHPGACTVSEAMLCDKEHADEILAYAFLHQEKLRNMASKDEKKLRSHLEGRFPRVKNCVGSAAIRNKVNKSLRWAVANALPVLTPQLFVGEQRVCDEDTDLGLEYTLAAMLDKSRTTPAARRR